MFSSKRYALFNKNVFKRNRCVLPMVLKTSMIKEPVKELITSFLVGPQTGDVINNLIIIYLNYINN